MVPSSEQLANLVSVGLKNLINDFIKSTFLVGVLHKLEEYHSLRRNEKTVAKKHIFHISC